MEEIYCRPAALSDLPVLYDFEQGIVEVERPWDSTLKAGHINYYDIKKMIESSDTEVVVAVSKDEVIGSAYISIRVAKPYLKHSHFAYLGFMFVKPEFRGMGVNKMIIEVSKTWALERGVRELRLDVYDENIPALRAYEKAGFERLLVKMRMEI